MDLLEEGAVGIGEGEGWGVGAGIGGGWGVEGVEVVGPSEGFVGHDFGEGGAPGAIEKDMRLVENS